MLLHLRLFLLEIPLLAHLIPLVQLSIGLCIVLILQQFEGEFFSLLSGLGDDGVLVLQCPLVLGANGLDFPLVCLVDGIAVFFILLLEPLQGELSG